MTFMPTLHDEHARGRALSALYRDKASQIQAQGAAIAHRAAYGDTGPGPWRSIGPRNINGRVKCLAVHPTNADVVYAGAAGGGVWKTDDGGRSWRPLGDGFESLAIGGLAVATPDTLYAATGEGVIAGRYGIDHNFPGVGLYVSRDGGVTWTKRDGLLNRRVTRMLASPSNSPWLAVAGRSGLELSTDDGGAWALLHEGEISDAVLSPAEPGVLYFCVHLDGLYRLEGVPASLRIRKLAGPVSGDAAEWPKVDVGRRGPHGGAFLVVKVGATVWQTTDGGALWTMLPPSGAQVYPGWCNVVAVDPDDEQSIFAGGIHLFHGPSPWTQLTPQSADPRDGLHADHHALVFAPSNPAIVYNANDGGVYRSDDRGRHWRKVSNGLVITQFYDVGSWATDSAVLGGGGQDVGTSFTTGGLTWTKIPVLADGMYFVIDHDDPRVMYFETQDTGLCKSTDGGQTSKAVTDGLQGGRPRTGVIAMDPQDARVLFTGTTQVYMTRDRCQTPWKPVSNELRSYVSAIAISATDPRRIYMGTGNTYYRTGAGRVFRSDNGCLGETVNNWTERTSILPSERPVMDIAVDPGNKDRVVVVYGSAGLASSDSLFLSENGGNTWRAAATGLPRVSVNAVVFDASDRQTIYAGTDLGVYRTTDGGRSWHVFDRGIPHVPVSDLDLDGARRILYAATMGRGMYRLSVGADERSVDLYVRDSVLDTGDRATVPAGVFNPLLPTERVFWWQSPDVKVVSEPSPRERLDGVEFDLDIPDRPPDPTGPAVVYLQIHNRGWEEARDVHACVFHATGALPLLVRPLTSPDFDPGPGSPWVRVGPAVRVPRVEPMRPEIVSWTWRMPAAAGPAARLLAVVSCEQDPVVLTGTDIATLVRSDKHLCLKAWTPPDPPHS
jgi:photosystem II stability/assembly factor-like uncharacterized protein